VRESRQKIGKSAIAGEFVEQPADRAPGIIGATRTVSRLTAS
jgi:hypothetical protein